MGWLDKNRPMGPSRLCTSKGRPTRNDREIRFCSARGFTRVINISEKSLTRRKLQTCLPFSKWKPYNTTKGYTIFRHTHTLRVPDRVFIYAVSLRRHFLFGLPRCPSSAYFTRPVPRETIRSLFAPYNTRRPNQPSQYLLILVQRHKCNLFNRYGKFRGAKAVKQVTYGADGNVNNGNLLFICFIYNNVH